MHESNNKNGTSENSFLVKDYNEANSTINSGKSYNTIHIESDCEIGLLPEPTDKYGILYLIFFISGVSMLLPWNVFITASDFFALKFQHSRYETTFQNFFSAANGFTNLSGLAYALISQRKKTLYSRSAKWLGVLAISFIALIFLSQNISLSAEVNFWFSVGLLITGALAGAFLNSDLIALAALIDPIYVQATVAGQGLAGLGVAIAQFIVKYSGTTAAPSHSLLPPDSLARDHRIIQQALWYFLSALVATLLAAFSFWCLLHHPLFKSIDLNSDDSNEGVGIKKRISDQWCLIKKLVKEQPESVANIFLTFAVTLSVFPGLISSARSTATEGFIHEFFLSICFVVFNLCDLIGRSLPALTGTEFISSRALGWLTISRLLFIPVFLMSHLELGFGIAPAFPAVFAFDKIFFLALASLSLSNGFFSAILMMTAPSRTSNPEHRGTMASVMALTLGLGLLTGSLFSFPVRALACACNPF